MLIPVSALSSWTYCPMEFYNTYVLKIKKIPEDIMIMGLIKHKLHENIAKQEQKIITSLKAENAQETLQNTYLNQLKTILVEHTNALRAAKIPIDTAFQKTIPVIKFEVEDKITTILPLLKKGITGEQLWQTITPKLKTEYPIQSEKLCLRGRIDRLECHENKLVPVELKSGKPPQEGAWPGHKIQATAYALMLEDKFNTTVPESAIHYIDQNARRILTINPFMKEEVIETTAKIKGCLNTKEKPKGCGKCPTCIEAHRNL